MRPKYLIFKDFLDFFVQFVLWPISLAGGYTVAEYSWFIANNFVISVYCRYLEILCKIAFNSIANYFRFYRKKYVSIESVGIHSRHP